MGSVASPKKNQPIRTLIFHPALAPYRIDLFNELARHINLKVLFLSENLVSQHFNQAHLRSLMKCEYGYLCSGQNILGRQLRWNIIRAISKFTPEVVVCPEYSPSSLFVSLIKFLGLAGRWGMIIWTADNVYTCKKVSLLRGLARKAILSITDGMIVYTDAVKDWYVQSGVDAEGIGVCPNIQSEVSFGRLLELSRTVAERYLCEHDLLGKRIVLFVGRLVKSKGVDNLIHAFAHTSLTFTDAVLVVVGDGPERSSLEKAVANYGCLDKVKFVGHREGSELHAWYLLGGVLVLASNFERFGAVVNEALLAGMYVICSSAAGASDLIREGQNGYVVRPNDTQELAQRINDILSRVFPLKDGLIYQRKNMMPILFSDAVKSFSYAVEYSSKKVRLSSTS